MNIIIRFLTPTIDFVKANMQTIIVVAVCLAVLCLGYIVTSRSLAKLKSSFFSYYPFDKFFPKSGSWSVLYFAITILLLGILAYLVIRGGFYFAPA